MVDHIENGFVRIRRCRHGWFMYNINDRFVSRSLDLYGEWAEPELEFIGQFIKPGDVVLDIGAHIGTHAVFFAKRVGADGRVFAFEPQRVSFELLCGNAALNNLLNLKCLNLAVGARNGVIEIPIVDPTTEFNYGGVSITTGLKGEPVPLVTVDSLGLAKCDFIKADVEGVEIDVLEGARETITRCRPILFLENDKEDKQAAIYDKLQEFGYRAFWQISSHYNPDNYFRVTWNAFKPYKPNVNIICLPPGTPAEGLVPVVSRDDTWKTALQRLWAGQPDRHSYPEDISA